MKGHKRANRQLVWCATPFAFNLEYPTKRITLNDRISNENFRVIGSFVVLKFVWHGGQKLGWDNLIGYILKGP